MSTTIPDDRFVTLHTYERDMERINRTLDKLIEYVQLNKEADARTAGEIQANEKHSTSKLQVKLLVWGAGLAVLGSLILNLIQVVFPH